MGANKMLGMFGGLGGIMRMIMPRRDPIAEMIHEMNAMSAAERFLHQIMHKRKPQPMFHGMPMIAMPVHHRHPVGRGWVSTSPGRAPVVTTSEEAPPKIDVTAAGTKPIPARDLPHATS